MKMGLVQAVAMGLSCWSVSAASLTWDATNTLTGVQEGSGNWTIIATDTNWWSGSVNSAWNNANGDIAVFGSNTVQVSSTLFKVTNTVDMTLGGLLFNQSYTVGAVGGSLLIFNDGSVITNASTNNTATANISAPVYTTGTIYRTGNRINWNNTSFNGGGTLVISTLTGDVFNNTNSFGGLSAIVMSNTTSQLDLRAAGVYAGGGTGPVLRIYGTSGISIQSMGGSGADWHGDIQLLMTSNAVMTGSGNNGTTPCVLTLSGNISGGGGLSVAGQNWGVVLSGTNSYGNGTTITAGNLTFANANALPLSGLITLANGSLIATGAINSVMTWLGNGRIATNGSFGGIAMGASEDITLGVYSNLFVGAAGTVNYTNTLTPGGATYRLGGGGGTLRFGQTIAGTSSLIIGPTNGVGAVLIANTANTFSGGTTLNAGYTGGAQGNSLLLGADNVLGTGRVTLNGGVLASDSNATRALTNAITLGGALQIGQYSAAIGGSNGSITLSGPINLSGGRTLNVTNVATTLLLSGIVTNTGNFTKIGAGTLALSNTNNTFSGGITLTTGTLALGGDNVLGGGTLSLNGGVLASDSATARTETNAVAIAANTQFGNTLGTGAVTLSGIINSGNSTKTLTVSNSITTFSNTITNNAALIKQGPGTLVLMGANSTFSGMTNLAGVLALGGDNVLGTGTVYLGGGTLASDGVATRTLTNALTIGANSTFGQASGGTGQLILSGPVYNGTLAKTWTINNPTTLVSGAISGTSASTLTKAGAGLLIFSGANSYTGSTMITAGALQFASLGAIGGTGASVTNTATVAFDFADVQSGLARLSTLTAGTVAVTTNSASSPISFNAAGLSNVWLGAIGQITYDLVANFTPYTAGLYKLGGGLGTLVITNQLAGSTALNIGGVGTGNVLLANTNIYTGLTQVQGNLTLGMDNALPTAGTVILGSGTGSAIGGTLDLGGYNQTLKQLLVSTDGAAATNVLIIGAGQTLTVTGGFTNGYQNTGITILTARGGGNLVISNSIQIAGSTNVTGPNNSIVNLGGLGNFTASLGTGAFHIGETISGNSGTASNLMILATNNTITARTLGIGDKSYASAGGTNTLSLGVGANALFVDALYVSGGKNSGLMNFAGNTGTLTVSNSAGTGRTALIVGVNSVGTGGSQAGTLDLRSHQVSLYLGSVTNGGRINGLPGNTAGYIYFDQGTLDITNLLMGLRTAASSGTVTSVLSIGGGVARIGPTLLASNAVAYAGTGVSALLDFSGGNITMSGNISKGGGVGPTTATLQMTNTATLDMGGFAIGSATTPLDAITLQSGTLMNVGEINGGTTPLTKTGNGVLVLDGNNIYNGGTTISSGTLQVGTGSTGGTLGNGTVNNAGTLAFNRSNTYTFTNTLTGNGTLVQLGGGTLNLTGDGSAFTGTTLVSNGTLRVNGALGGLINVYNGGTLGGSNALPSVTLLAGGILNPGNGPGLQLVTNLTLNAGTLQLELQNTNSFDQVIVANSLTLTPSTTNYLHLVLASFSPDVGATYLIVRNDSLTPWDGSSILYLSDLSLDNNSALTNNMVFRAMGETSSNIFFRINYDFAATGDGVANDILLTVVPEPTSGSLLLLCGALYGLRRLAAARKTERS